MELAFYHGSPASLGSFRHALRHLRDEGSEANRGAKARCDLREQAITPSRRHR